MVYLLNMVIFHGTPSNNQMVYGSVKAMKMGMNPELPSVDPHCLHQNIVFKLLLGCIPHFSDTPKFNNKWGSYNCFATYMGTSFCNRSLNDRFLYGLSGTDKPFLPVSIWFFGIIRSHWVALQPWGKKVEFQGTEPTSVLEENGVTRLLLRPWDIHGIVRSKTVKVLAVSIGYTGIPLNIPKWQSAEGKMIVLLNGFGETIDFQTNRFCQCWKTIPPNIPWPGWCPIVSHGSFMLFFMCIFSRSNLGHARDWCNGSFKTQFNLKSLLAADRGLYSLKWQCW